MATLISGKEVSAKVRADIKAQAEVLGIQPGLAVIIVGENPASQVYVRNKKKACEEVGFYSLVEEMPESTTQDELIARIKELESDYNSNIESENEYMNPQLMEVVCNMVSRKANGLISEEEKYIGKLKRLKFMIFESMLRENKTIHASSPQDGIPTILKKANQEVLCAHLEHCVKNSIVEDNDIDQKIKEINDTIKKLSN